MKIIINKNNLEIIAEEEFRQLHPNISFPVILSESALESTDYVIKDLPPQPPLSPYQTVDVVVSRDGDEIVASYDVTTQLPPLNVLLKNYEEAIDNLIDAKAKEYNYNNVYTMISYRGDPNPKFNQEAESMFLWRSQVWTTVNTLLSTYMTTLGESGLDIEDIPSVESILAAIPPFTLLEE